MIATIQMLEDAQKAYHSLMLGGSVIEMRDQNGEMIKYSVTNPSRLLAYIQWLKTELGLTAPSGPMRVWM